jgi:hypothetical protein
MKKSRFKASVVVIALIISIATVDRSLSASTHYDDLDADYELKIYFEPFLVGKKEPEIRTQIKIGRQFFVKNEKQVDNPIELPNGDKIT